MIMPITFAPLYTSLTDPFARLDLINACGGVAFEDHSMFSPGVASTPGMPKGARPVFWQSETALLAAANAQGLNLSGFPQALLLALKGTNPLLVGRLVNPIPSVYFAFDQPTLTPQVLTTLITAIRALIPA